MPIWENYLATCQKKPPNSEVTPFKKARLSLLNGHIPFNMHLLTDIN